MQVTESEYKSGEYDLLGIQIKPVPVTVLDYELVFSLCKLLLVTLVIFLGYTSI